ncbi:putative glutathione S-transferase [Bradyrhizobium sp. USDA 4516]
MKLMMDGEWKGDIAAPPKMVSAGMVHDGRFRRSLSKGPSLDYPVEPGRYRLYVSYACPFAHRALVVHALKRLQGLVPISLLHPIWDRPEGWTFDASLVGGNAVASDLQFLHEAYSATDPGYTGKVTVPVLWDTRTRTIVNNESIEIAKMLCEAFDPLGADCKFDLYPRSLRPQIDELNARIGNNLSKGVYAVGQAENQAAYETAMDRLFGFLDEMEELVGGGRPFLLADQPTLSDVLIFTPLVRFDCVYNPLFRASRRRLVDYRALAALTKRIYQLPGVEKTVRFDHILTHYYDGDWGVASRRGITPEAPIVDFRSAL